MAKKKNNIDRILQQWPYTSEDDSVRMVVGSDGREVIQMRIELGVLQLETTGRPDGTHPEGSDTYYDYLVVKNLHHGDDEEDRFVMSEDECEEADREFVQYYHRRICWLQLGEYRQAVKDADHSLSLMDFCRDHSPDEHWTMSHEQYRPFVLFHRTQASALALLDEHGAGAAMNEINIGLEQIRALFIEFDVEEQFDEDELVERLSELREKLRNDFDVGRTLNEQLQDAVVAEKYELAARIRDELARRKVSER